MTTTDVATRPPTTVAKPAPANPSVIDGGCRVVYVTNPWRWAVRATLALFAAVSIGGVTVTRQHLEYLGQAAAVIFGALAVLLGALCLHGRYDYRPPKSERSTS
jgi:hypothetical protein